MVKNYFQFVLGTLIAMSLPCDETPCWICDKFSGMAIVAAEAAAVCWETTTKTDKVLQHGITLPFNYMYLWSDYETTWLSSHEALNLWT